MKLFKTLTLLSLFAAMPSRAEDDLTLKFGPGSHRSSMYALSYGIQDGDVPLTVTLDAGTHTRTNSDPSNPFGAASVGYKVGNYTRGFFKLTVGSLVYAYPDAFDRKVRTLFTATIGNALIGMGVSRVGWSEATNFVFLNLTLLTFRSESADQKPFENK